MPAVHLSFRRIGWVGGNFASGLVADYAFASAVMVGACGGGGSIFAQPVSNCEPRMKITLRGRLLPDRAARKSPYSNPESC